MAIQNVSGVRTEPRPDNSRFPCDVMRVVQYTRSVTGRQTGVDPLRIVTGRLSVSLLVRDGLRKYSRRCYCVCGEFVDGSSRSERIATTRHVLDGW